LKKIRNLHLWIGLLTSFLILIEAVTGLLMVEPWLIGAGRPAAEHRATLEKTAAGEVSVEAGFGSGGMGAGRRFNPAGQGNSIMSFVKNLHSGRIGGTDVSLLLDIIAVGLIILTITGMVLSVKALKTNSGGRRRT